MLRNVKEAERKMNNNEVQDPLKALNEIYEPDERQAFFVGQLPDNHQALSLIILNDSVPLEVKQLFETAKNLSLYSWFCYRFHQVAELISFAAMEMALRERYVAETAFAPSSEDKQKRRAPTLYGLLQHAKKEKWLTNDGFPSLYNRARYSAELSKANLKSKTHDYKKEPQFVIEEPTDEEIALALESMDMVAAVTDHSHDIRNRLAHGSSILHCNSISSLSLNAEVINQIYPKKN